MKKLLFWVLLAAIAAPAYAGKNAKPLPKSKTLKPKLSQQPTVQPSPAADTAWQGTGKEHNEFGMRSYDARVGRYMHVAPPQPAKQ